jgi:hypothetical protein
MMGGVEGKDAGRSGKSDKMRRGEKERIATDVIGF